MHSNFIPFIHCELNKQVDFDFLQNKDLFTNCQLLRHVSGNESTEGQAKGASNQNKSCDTLLDASVTTPMSLKLQ